MKSRSALIAFAFAMLPATALAQQPMFADNLSVIYADGTTSEELARRLAREPDIEYAVPDQRRRRATAPNDPLYSAGVPGNGPAVGQWYLRAPDSTVASSIDIEPAWAVTMGSPGIVVADITE